MFWPLKLCCEVKCLSGFEKSFSSHLHCPRIVPQCLHSYQLIICIPLSSFYIPCCILQNTISFIISFIKTLSYSIINCYILFWLALLVLIFVKLSVRDIYRQSMGDISPAGTLHSTKLLSTYSSPKRAKVYH